MAAALEMIWVPRTSENKLFAYYSTGAYERYPIIDPTTGQKIDYSPSRDAERNEWWREVIVPGPEGLHFFCSILLKMRDMTLPDRIHGDICRLAQMQDHPYLHKHKRLSAFFECARGFLKTSIVTCGEGLRRIALNPDDTQYIVSSSPDNAKKNSVWMRNQIEDNLLLRAVFPNLQRGAPWTNEQFNVKRSGHGLTSQDYTCMCFGALKPSTGGHPNRVVFDDLVNDVNFKTPATRDSIKRVYAGYAPMLRDGGIEHVTGTPFHEDDLYATYKATMVEEGRALHLSIPARTEDGELTWPERFDEGTLAYVRTQMNDDALFEAQMMLNIQPESLRKIKSGDFNYFDHEITPEEAKAEWVVVIGCDTSTGEGADSTAIVAWGVNRKNEHAVLEIRAGKWEYDEAITEFMGMARKWGCRFARLETVSGYKTIGQAIEREMKRTGDYIVLTCVSQVHNKVARIASSLQPLYAAHVVWHQPSMKGSVYERQLQWSWKKGDKNDLIDAGAYAADEAQERRAYAPGLVKPPIERTNRAVGIKTVPGTGAELFAEVTRSTRTKTAHRSPLRLL